MTELTTTTTAAEKAAVPNASPAEEALFLPAIVLMSGRMLGFLATFALPMVLARVLDQTEFGTYKQIFLIYGTLFGIAQVGVAESLYYFLPNAAARAGAFVINCLVITTVTGLLCFLGLTLLAEPVASMMNNEALAPYIPAIGLYLFFMLVAVVLEITLTVRKKHLMASVAYAVSDIGRVILIVIPVLLFPGIKWLMIGAVAFAFLRFLAALANIFKVYGRDLKFYRPSLNKHLAYALPFGFAAIIEIVQMNFHMFVVSAEFDTATFALYAVGCLQIPLFDFLMTSTSNVMMVNMKEKIKDNKLKAVVPIWNDAVSKLFMVYCPLALLLILSAHELIVFLFTETYVGSVPIFMVWTTSLVFMVFLTDGVLRVFADTRFLIIQNFIRLAVVVALIHFFIERFDLIGAVLVTLVAIIVTKIIAFARMASLMQVSMLSLLPWRSLSRVLLISLISAIPVLLLKAMDIEIYFIYLALAFSIYPLLYLGLLFFFGPLSERDKESIVEMMQIPLRKVRRAMA